MCGICGKLNFDSSRGVSGELLKSMADAIRHRGPDDEGYYRSKSLGLGFRRLSIIDLKTGHQPMSNEDGSIWIVFNGEIYNYQDLREWLLKKGHVFKSQTDTEVIVHLYEEFGASCVEKLRGMFAFAIWDDTNQTLLLARDRVGIKPLYYRLTNSGISFGSEIKAILADPEAKALVQPQMVDRFLTFYYLPGDETLFQGIKKLAPGHYMMVEHGTAQITQYWDLQFSQEPRDTKSAKDELLALLEESMKLHMISDVPVGFLLSGGIDSTALLGFAVGKSDHKLSSYTVGFTDSGVIDERPYARQAASMYGSEHHEITIGSQQFADFLPQYVWHMEEPVCEPPAVALYYVSALAREFVKVLISGEGGDEAFAGYPDYRSILWLERVKKLCKPMNAALSEIAGLLSELPGAHKLRKYAPLLNSSFGSYYYSRASSPFTFFNAHISELYTDEFREMTDKGYSTYPARQHLQNSGATGTLARMLYVDTKTWLPDDLLIKADKMTMANSVELRVPLLDHKILEFAASLPTNHKIRGLTTKYIAKKALGQRVPKEILNRKKAGFPVPYDRWLRRELNGWLRDILLDRATLARGYFRRTGIEALLLENRRSGRYSKELFSLLVLELWHREFLKGDSAHVLARASGRAISYAQGF
jgi:asparagine synthase (glutamine-hydrolysing)